MTIEQKYRETRTMERLRVKPAIVAMVRCLFVAMQAGAIK